MAVVKIHNADKIMRLLRALPREVTSNQRGGVMAQAMRSGARPMLNEARVRLQQAIDEGGWDESTGLLMKNLKLRRHKPKGWRGEHFTLGVGNKRYPAGNKTYQDKRGRSRPVLKKGASTKKNATRMEYGSSHQKATPWLRPAFAATAQDVIYKISGDLGRKLDRLAKKHLDQT